MLTRLIELIGSDSVSNFLNRFLLYRLFNHNKTFLKLLNHNHSKILTQEASSDSAGKPLSFDFMTDYRSKTVFYNI